MALIRINRHPPANQLWLFAGLWFAFAAVWSVILGVRGGWTTLPISLAALSLAAPILGLISREGLRRLYVAMCYAAFPIGFVVSHILLAFVYYCVITPIGLVMRLTGYDPLQRKLDREAETYWSPRAEVKDKSRYFRQF